MTIQRQNAINAECQPPLGHHPGIVPVPVWVSSDIAARMGHYLDAHPGESWDSVVEAALANRREAPRSPEGERRDESQGH